jgi:hypothetical protein
MMIAMLHNNRRMNPINKFGDHFAINKFDDQKTFSFS